MPRGLLIALEGIDGSGTTTGTPAVLWFGLSEPCGALFSMTNCVLGLQLQDDRVTGAWLHDTDADPWNAECLYGCGREDMRERMSAHY